MSTHEALEALLRRAQSLGVEGNLAGAASALEQARGMAPDDPRVLHLLGVTRWQAGEPSAALELLERAAALTPGRAESHYVLARVTESLHGAGAALSGYARTVELAPGFAPAWADLGVARAEAGDLDGAVTALERARDLGAGDTSVLYSLGQALRGLGRDAEAAAVLGEALRESPGDPMVLHALALTLRAGGDLEGARRALEAAAARAPDDAEVQLALGSVLDELGLPGAALASYRRAVTAEPASTAAHDALNRALWEAGEHAEHLRSYATAITRVADPSALRREYARWLERVGRHREAVEQLRPLMQGRDAEVHRLMARALANTGDSDGALEHFRRAVEVAPADAAARRDLARMLIMLDEVGEAGDQVRAALALAPFDQEAIAYLGLCWRLAGDPRHAALNDYTNLVRSYRIPVPEGYDDITAFNRALARDLDRLHGGAVHPADQTLRGGTQTHGDLFAMPVHTVQQVRESIARCVRAYIDEMQPDPEHPLTSRRQPDFHFAASWSCRLREQGFHTNHVHPKGWISSCYYVSLPEAVRSRADNQGWITFGESNLRLGERERIGRSVQPEEGLLVLFPSYLFHGTVPFQGDEARTTIAFDVVPGARTP